MRLRPAKPCVYDATRGGQIAGGNWSEGGIRHSAFYKSNSDHSAARSSPGRTKTSGASFKASPVTGCPV